MLSDRRVQERGPGIKPEPRSAEVTLLGLDCELGLPRVKVGDFHRSARCVVFVVVDGVAGKFSARGVFDIGCVSAGAYAGVSAADGQYSCPVLHGVSGLVVVDDFNYSELVPQ